MIPKKLTIENIGIISHIEIPFGVPIIKLYGRIQNGKTTILNAVRWLTGTSLPSDLIRHGEDEGFIRIDYENDTYIERSFYRGKNGEIKARAVTFIREGVAVEKPAKVLKNMSEGFVSNQDTFNNLSLDDKRKYFVNTLGLDTDKEDKRLTEIVAEAKVIRKTIKDVGTVKKLDPVEEPESVDTLIAKRKEITERNEKTNLKYLQLVKGRESVIAAKADAVAERKLKEHRLKELKAKFAEIKAEGEKLQQELKEQNVEPAPTEVPIPTLESTEEIDSALNKIAEDTIAFNEYIESVKVAEQVAQHKAKMSKLEKEKKAIEKEKGEKLIALNDKHGIDGLVFHSDGKITYKDTALDMLSDSQQFSISYELASAQINELGILPLDRAESLGRSIDDYIHHAKAQGFTVLASIVGECPAEKEEEVGVFVVQNGEIKNAQKPTKKAKKKESSNKVPVKEEKATEPTSNESTEPITEEGLPVPNATVFDRTAFIEKLSRVLPAATTMIALAESLVIEGNKVIVTFDSDHEFQYQELTKHKNIEDISGYMSKFLEAPVTAEYVLLQDKEEESSPEQEPEENPEPTPSSGDFNFGNAEW